MMFPWQMQLGLLLLLAPATAHCFLDGRANNLSPLEYGNQTPTDGANDLSAEFAPGFDLISLNTPSDFDLGEIIRRERRECPPGTLSCGDGRWCHLPGNFCCPRDRSVSCPTGHTCCDDSRTCAPPGRQCCPGQRYNCPIGTSCCPNGQGCVPPGGSCCGDTVCLANEKCCGGTHCAPKTSACCGDGYCAEAGSTCCDGVACAKAGMVCCGGGVRQACPVGEACCTDQMGPYCGRGGRCLPTLKFPNVRGVTDEAADNLCKGLKAFFKKNGHNEFSWNGPGRANRRITRANRRAAGCGGGLVCPAGYNCDEFPLASTAEGGAGASIKCIPVWLNGFYGYVWNIWRISQLKSGFKKGSKFRIIMDGCDFTDVTKRSDMDFLEERTTNEVVLSSKGDVTVFDGALLGDGTEGNNVVFIPLTKDDGNPGRYTLDYTLKEGQSITSGWIMDEDGEIYETLDELQPGASNTTTFELEDAGDGPVYFYGWTKATEVEMDLSIKEPLPPASSSSETPVPTASGAGNPAPTTKDNAGGRVKAGLGSGSGSGLCILAAGLGLLI